MDDFGMLARDFGFRPQGKSAPMKSDGGDFRSRPPSSSSPSPFAADENQMFNDVFGGPPKFTNNNSRSTPAVSDIDYDSIFKNSSSTNNNEAKSTSASSNLPVYDKPVYDDDIFDGLPGMKSKSMHSASARYEDNIFASMTASPPKRSQKSDHFDDLLGNLGRTEKVSRALTLPAAQTLSTGSWYKPDQHLMAEQSRSTNCEQRHTRKKRKLTIQTELLAPNCTHTSRHKKRGNSDCVYDNRRWVFSTRDCSKYKDKFVFVSYNILGVENASNHKDLYFNVLPKFMKWEHRRRVIRKEIARYSPSILCFQEVDRFDDLNNILQKDGFRGVYQARTGEARDGCAIFWKDELFSLLHQDNIEFKRFGLRDNVAQFCVLKMNGYQKHIGDTENLKAQPSRNVLVGNIHVLFNPSRGDVKLGQVRLFLANAHRLSQTWGNIPIILGGDLNSMPQSAMYEFIASSELNIQHHERKRISGQICPLDYPRFQSNYSSRPLLHRWSKEELRLATGTEGSVYLRHNLKLNSAYHGVPASRLTRDSHGEPLATSFHSRFMGTVDYIWHTDDLVPVKVLETLPIEILKKTRGLPSKIWGSDHLALVCELAFADDNILSSV